MRRFFIIVNEQKDIDLQVTEKIKNFMDAHQCIYQIKVTNDSYQSAGNYMEGSVIPDDTECILVLGGDGTLLQAARDTFHKEILLLTGNTTL